MVRVRQKLDHSHIEPEEIPALVQRELEPMRSRIRTGMRVAITCGSRGWPISPSSPGPLWIL